jgi:putative MATE family efflux protein
MNKNITDMTTGSTPRHILTFALPLLIGNLFQQLYNMVDSLVVGNFVGANALAAVGNCGSLSFLLFSLSSGLSVGIGILVSQYFGARDEENVRITIANSYYVLGITSVTVTVIGIVFSPGILRMISTPDTIIGDSIVYMRVTSAGMIAIALYNGVSSILRALGDSKTPLYFLIIASIINVVLDLFFVLVLRWNVFGVALATVLSQTAAAAVSLFYAYKKVSYFHLTRKQLRPRKKIIIRSFKLGMPVALQNSMISISCIVLQSVVNTFGETVMAAYTIIGRVEQLVQQPYGSLGMALTTYTGQNIGAVKNERVKAGFRTSTLTALLFSIALIPLCFLTGKLIIGAFVKDSGVIALGVEGLRIDCVFYFALGMIYVARSILNGCGDTGFALFNGMTEVVCRILYSQLFIRIPALGYRGIWITTGATWTTTAVVCVIRYCRGKWKTAARY